MLIALLSQIGYDGFEEEQHCIKAYIQKEQFSETELENTLNGFKVSHTVSELPERNWNEEWETNFTPVVVNNFVAVRAHFHAPVPGVRHQLIVTPKMSFGTGHHATTYMMMEAMGKLLLEGANVLDFGTGTGILAILAEKLGAAEVDAVDNDDWCITNALENVAQNNSEKVNVFKNDRIGNGKKYDVVLANINKHIIISNLAAIYNTLTSGKLLLASGLLQDDKEDVTVAAEAAGFQLLEVNSRDKWLCMLFQR